MPGLKREKVPGSVSALSISSCNSLRVSPGPGRPSNRPSERSVTTTALNSRKYSAGSPILCRNCMPALLTACVSDVLWLLSLLMRPNRQAVCSTVMSPLPANWCNVRLAFWAARRPAMVNIGSSSVTWSKTGTPGRSIFPSCDSTFCKAVECQVQS